MAKECDRRSRTKQRVDRSAELWLRPSGFRRPRQHLALALKQGDKYHHRFWSQVIRWAASDRALTAGNDFVRFGVREPVYRSDQEVELLVRLSEQVRKLDKDALAASALASQDKARRAGRNGRVGAVAAQSRNPRPTRRNPNKPAARRLRDGIGQPGTRRQVDRPGRKKLARLVQSASARHGGNAQSRDQLGRR